MSLQRHLRNSWEERSYKRAAGSQSPPHVPRFEKIKSESMSPPADHSSTHMQIPSYSPRQEAFSSDSLHLCNQSDFDSDASEHGYPEERALTPDVEKLTSNLDSNICERTPGVQHIDSSVEITGRRASPEYGEHDPSSTGKTPINPTQPPTFTTTSPITQIPPSIPSPVPEFHTNTAPNEYKDRNPSSAIFRPEKSTSSGHSQFTFSSTNSTTSTKSNPLGPSDIEMLERQMLHSPTFPSQFLRPVPTLIQLMSQMAPTMGDPGSGFTNFGPQSPKKSVFVSPKAKYVFDNDPLQQGFLEDRIIGSRRTDWLEWERKPSPPPARKGQSAAIPVPRVTSETYLARKRKIEDSNEDLALSNAWTGRRYSVNPEMKTRHLEFDVLQRKINHYELLSLDLSMDARRDAVAIGGSQVDVGPSLLDERGASEKGLATDGSSSSVAAKRHASALNTNANTNIASAAGFATAGITSHQRSGGSNSTRSKERARDSSIFTPTLPLGRSRVSSKHADASKKMVDGYDIKQRRWRAQDVGMAFDTGRYGMGGVMLWRLVRVAARINVDGEETEQHAWYCVPDRALGGWF